MTQETPSFAADVKPLFREGDRSAMDFAFDLWAYDDVAENADAILSAVANGSMPCDRRWSETEVDTLRSWIEGGKPA
jgi:hypothetical protein